MTAANRVTTVTAAQIPTAVAPVRPIPSARTYALPPSIQHANIIQIIEMIVRNAVESIRDQ